MIKEMCWLLIGKVKAEYKKTNMDFENLKLTIEHAAKKAFLEMFEKHGAEDIYAFALYSDEDAMTVCPSTNTLKYLSTKDQDENLASYKFEPAEWKYEMKGADKEFSEISKQLNAEHDAKVFYDNGVFNEEHFLQFQGDLFQSCIEVLEKLKNEDFFKKVTGKAVFLNFTVSDYDFEASDMKKIVERLNDNAYQTEYLNWVKTWDL